MSIDYDTYLARQVDNHTKESYFYSDCCGVEMDPDDLVCPECYEHCTAVSEEDRAYDKLAEIADQKYQQEKDEREF